MLSISRLYLLPAIFNTRLPFRGLRQLCHLPQPHVHTSSQQEGQKDSGDDMSLSSHGHTWEVIHITVLTFYWLEPSHMTTSNCKEMSLAKWPSAQPNFLLPLMREQILGGSTVMLVSVYSPIFHSPTKNHPFGQPGLLSSPSAPRILLSTPLLALSPYMGFPSPFPCPPQSCTSFKAVLSPP